jgi:ubiquinone/menaquinone biosynthesis C-methylase UbiE
MWTEFLYPRLNKYTNGHILELAPGHGRITKYLAMIADKLSIVDLNSECINACKEKFKIFDNIEYFVNDGNFINTDGKKCQSINT